MRKALFQLTVSVMLLGYFSFRVDWTTMAAAFTGIYPGWYLLSTLGALSGPLIMTGKYRLLIARTTLDLPFLRLAAINYIARFYALFLPSALGPEAVRWYKVTKNRKGKIFFLASTIVERLFFVLVLFVCGAAPLFLSRDPAVADLSVRLKPLMAVAGAVLGLALVYFLGPGLQQKFRSLVIKRFHLSPESRLHVFLDNFSLKNSSSGMVGVLFLYTLLWQGSFLARMYFLFVSLGLPFGFWDVTWMGSLVMLLQIIPVSFAGLGLREGAYAFLFSVQGVPTEFGVVAGLLFFSQMLVLCAIGALCLLFEKQTETDTAR